MTTISPDMTKRLSNIARELREVVDLATADLIKRLSINPNQQIICSNGCPHTAQEYIYATLCGIAMTSLDASIDVVKPTGTANVSASRKLNEV